MSVDLYQGILTTRAIRRFTDEPVTDEEIGRCLRAAMQAPSGGNSQPFQFVVVRQPSSRTAIARLYREAYERWERAQLAALPAFRDRDAEEVFRRGLRASRLLAERLESAPALVLVLMLQISIAPVDEQGPVEIGPLYASVYPAVQNLILAARSQGLGTVLTTVWWSRQQELRQLLDIPDRFEIVALLPIGRPQGRFGVAPRKPWQAVTHWDRFGARRPVGE